MFGERSLCAQAAVEHWQQIAGTVQRREDARRAAEAAEAQRQAEEQAEEQARKEAEREDAERRERQEEAEPADSGGRAVLPESERGGQGMYEILNDDSRIVHRGKPQK